MSCFSVRLGDNLTQPSDYFDTEAATKFAEASQYIQSFTGKEGKTVQNCMAQIESCFTEAIRQKYSFCVTAFINMAQKELTERVNDVGSETLLQQSSKALFLAEVYSFLGEQQDELGAELNAFLEQCSKEQLEAFLVLYKNEVIDRPNTKYALDGPDSLKTILQLRMFVDFVCRFQRKNFDLKNISAHEFLSGALVFFSIIENPITPSPYPPPEPFGDINAMIVMSCWSKLCPYLIAEERRQTYVQCPGLRDELFNFSKDLGFLEQDIASLTLSIVPTEILLEFLGSKQFTEVKTWLNEIIQTTDGEKKRIETMSPQQKRDLCVQQPVCKELFQAGDDDPFSEKLLPDTTYTYFSDNDPYYLLPQRVLAQLPQPSPLDTKSKDISRFTAKENVPYSLHGLGCFASALCKFFDPQETNCIGSNSFVHAILLATKGSYDDELRLRFGMEFVAYLHHHQREFESDFKNLGIIDISHLPADQPWNEGRIGKLLPYVCACMYGKVINIFEGAYGNGSFTTNERAEIVPEDHSVLHPLGNPTGEPINILLWNHTFRYLKRRKQELPQPGKRKASEEIPDQRESKRRKVG